MALQIKDRIRETSTTTGTGTYTLAGAVTGFLPFSGISDGDTTYYLAERDSQWEVGLGTVGGSGTTLARTTILKSSNSDAAVNWGSGTKQIAAVVPAALLSVLAEVSGGTLAEYVRDTIGTALTGGDNITVTPNDGGDTITVAVTAMTASRAVVTDGSGNLSVASVTATELGYVSGASSNLQAQITALQALTIRQPKVIARVDNTAAPPTEVSGDRYLLDATGSSHADWDGAAANSIVEFDGTSWVETVPAEGWVVYNDDTDTDWLAVNDGTLSWQERSTSVTSLNGLLDVVISSPAAGEYLRYNGSGWVNAEILAADISDPENLSITASQVSNFAEAVDDRVDALLVEGSGISLTYDDVAGTLTVTSTSVGSGEANTASNVGASGIGVFHQKSGVDLQLRKLVGGSSNTIDVTLNSNVVEFDLDAGLADLNDVDDSLSGAAGGLFFHDDDDWTDLDIGDPNNRLEVRDGLPSWQPRAEACLVRVVATANVSFDGPYDVSLGSYASKSLLISAQEGTPTDLAFSSDGTKAYVIGYDNDTVYQYTLSTPWDVSTGSYASKSMSVAAQDASPAGLAFSSDGTKCYVAGNVNDTVYQYTLSTPWDISTGSYASKSLDVSGRDTGLTGVTFSADGTKCYIVGVSTDSVYQYTLSTAWDISTGSYASKSLDVSGESNSPQGIAFRPDGKRMTVASQTGDLFYYTLSTAWDISTGSYASKSLDVSTEDGLPKGVAYNDDGTTAYIMGTTSETIYQYTLSAATDPNPIDGVTLANDDRILLAAQTDDSENGVYDCVDADDASTWTRVADMAAGGAASGRVVAVTAGTTYATTIWICTTAAGSDVVGTNDLTFTQFV